ncbi:ABC1 kinase family protein [Mesobacterium pallidum]|uniref:ABC1 kinase family protein n=1 Tax=Mesobacterium pallidum TaxID=2872037 RepID=UPI001EE275A6|nr:AarF/ABC1/UbiB kinase family protein [Mesobacterium pallidum]
MDDRAGPSRPLKVPAGRMSRLARLGGLTAGVAGTMALQALGDVARGTRPEARRLLMTPGNLRRVADELARMRGAAMKVGQILSMDAGELLPPELAGILARLRDQAHVMPPSQLKQALTGAWGPDWQRAFRQFDVRPVAAASIGQVHRATLKDGRTLAIKVQYPGIAQSIDSDVANVGALVRLSGLVPKGLDLALYLEEARRQLHEETDYLREGAQMERFAALLDGSATFAVPRFHADWSGRSVLAMDFMAGRPIESVAALDADGRNRVMAALVDLALREVFAFGVVQSDPNFANYLHNADTGRIVLLDFGAVRDLDGGVTQAYRDLLRAGLAGDAGGVQAAARDLGLIAGGPFDPRILRMIAQVLDAIGADRFDFADRTLVRQLNAEGMALADAGYAPPPVPMDVLYIQRKLGGLFLLGSRLEARLSLREIIAPYL